MKVQRGSLPGDTARSDNDNFRIKRYVAKYTINPPLRTASPTRWARSVGKWADIVILEARVLRRETCAHPPRRG